MRWPARPYPPGPPASQGDDPEPGGPEPNDAGQHPAGKRHQAADEHQCATTKNFQDGTRAALVMLSKTGRPVHLARIMLQPDVAAEELQHSAAVRL